jgi:tetratricopeptide (TPR) repeat protein
MSMKPIAMIAICAAVGLAGARPAPVRADEADAPLAVTALAAPSLRATPSAVEQGLSDKYLRAGLDLLKKNALRQAVQALLDSVRLAPGADNYKALGTAYYQVGNAPKALWAYQESLERRPDAKVEALAEQLEGRPSAPQAVSAAAMPAMTTATAAAGKAGGAGPAPAGTDGRAQGAGR